MLKQICPKCGSQFFILKFFFKNKFKCDKCCSALKIVPRNKIHLFLFYFFASLFGYVFSLFMLDHFYLCISVFIVYLFIIAIISNKFFVLKEGTVE